MNGASAPVRSRRLRSTRSAAAIAALVVALVAQVGGATPASAAPPTIVSFTATVSELNKITLNWQVSGGEVYIFDAIGYQPQACPDRQPTGCSTTLRVETGGVHRFTLSVRNAANEFTTRTVEATVNPLAPPSSPSYRVDVDINAPTAQTLRWNRSGSGFVKIYTPGQFFTPLPTDHPASGSYAVPLSALPSAGSATYNLKYCERFAAGQTPLCSAWTKVEFVVGPARFSLPTRKFAAANQPYTLSWAGSGNVFQVSIPTLSFQQLTTARTITIPAATMKPGTHRVELTNCTTGTTTVCANVAAIKAPSAGAASVTAINGASVTSGQTVGSFVPDGGTATNLTVPTGRNGKFESAGITNGQRVTAGQVLGQVRTTTDVDATELVVGGAQANWTTKAWSTDYTAATYDTSLRPGTGGPLDVTFDNAGDPWQIDEFSSAVSQVKTGSLTHHPAPILKVNNSATGKLEPVKPHRSALFGANNPTNTSALGERIIDTGRHVWYTHGGGLFNQANGNHSRLIRFDRTATDNPGTVNDERLCAVHVPGDRNEVVGIAYQKAYGNQPARIWFSESRPSNQPATNGAISSFLDDANVPCANDLNYNDAAAVSAANQANATRCASATKAGCITQTVLPNGAARPAHIEVDTDTSSLWITDMFGSVLSRALLIAPSLVVSYPLPAPARAGGYFKGYPWQVRADADAVYFNEYNDNQLVRFDKKRAIATGDCDKLVNGANPCIKELFLPAGLEVQSHSIALRDGKLWFTVAFDGSAPRDPNVSYVGYVDTATWRTGTPTGVLYNGLGTLGTPRPGETHSFRGIEVNAAGKVALADAGLKELVVLTRR